MPSFTLKPFDLSDYDSWYPLWRAYQAFYKTDIPESTSRIIYSRFLDPNEPLHGVFAMDNDKPVGIVHFIEHRSCWSIGDYCYLQDLFTHPDYRGRGVGRLLIEHVYRQAVRLGCSRVYWLTHETNLDAMKLYDRVADKSGFVQYRKLF